MCAALTEAFTALRKSGTTGLPRNLAVLHRPALRPVAVRRSRSLGTVWIYLAGSIAGG
jgi:hypothetical protein